MAEAPRVEVYDGLLRDAMRLVGDSLVGTTIARYASAGPDSVMNMRTTGKRAP